MSANFPPLRGEYTLDPYGYVRRKADPLSVGDVMLGRDFAIRVAVTVPIDVHDIVEQIECATALTRSGCEIVRRRVSTPQEAAALKLLRTALITTAPLVAVVTTGLETALEALRWASGVAVWPSKFSADELKFLMESCKQHERCLELVLTPPNRTRSKAAITGLSPLLVQLQSIATGVDYDGIVFSLEGVDLYSTVATYRYLSALLQNLDWPCPLHLAIPVENGNEREWLTQMAGLTTLLEDGIGDSFELRFDTVSTTMEQSYRLLRRYVKLNAARLQQAGIDDDSYVVVAEKRANALQPMLTLFDRGWITNDVKRLDEYPFIVTTYPDYRDPYNYTRRITRPVAVGSVTVGGDNPVATLGWLDLDNLLQENGSKTTPNDIYVVSELTPAIRELQAQALIDRPVIVMVQSLAQLEAAVEAGCDGVMYSYDGDAHWREESENDFAVLLARIAAYDVPLYLISICNVGQSWGSYDYWHNFLEAEQLLKLIEQCQLANLQKLVVGIYTYNAALNIQNVRLLAARLSERNWPYPIHIVAPDLMTNSDVEVEHILDSTTALASLLLDGLGDSLQTDYFEPEYGRPNFTRSQTELATQLFKVIENPS